MSPCTTPDQRGHCHLFDEGPERSECEQDCKMQEHHRKAARENWKRIQKRPGLLALLIMAAGMEAP